MGQVIAKENEAYKVLEMSGGGTIAHDDRLLIRGQKHEVGLSEGWRDTVDVRRSHGGIKIVNYFDRETGKYLSCEYVDALPYADPGRYRPQCLRGLDLGNGASVDLLNNQVDLYILDLFHNPESRYRSALEAMLDLADRGTLAYTPRVEETPRNRREALRNRLKRYMKPTEYEHDILLDGDIGQAVHADLRASGKALHLEDNTVYLRGYKPDPGQTRYSMKAYDVDARDGNSSGSRFKIETTLRKAYFKQEEITVADMTFQPEIQERMQGELEKALGYAVSLLQWGTKEMLAYALKVETRDARKIDREVARAMLRPERTLTARVDALERDVQAIKRRLDKAGIPSETL